MEKGSFHTSGVIFDADEVVKNIPLPNELPKGLEFSEFSPAMANSSTLEGLISQNEDLMARLSVAIRKMGQLEERLAETEKENLNFRVRFQTLSEQHMILQEKDRFSANRAVQLHDEKLQLEEKNRKLEHSYSDVFVKAQSFQRRLIQLERYRAHVQKLRPSLQAKAKKFPQVEAELRELKADLLGRTAKLHHTYETKLQEARAEINDLRLKLMDRNQIYEEKLQLINQVVADERRFENYRSECEREISKLHDETGSLRLQVKDGLVLQEVQQQKIEMLSNELPVLMEANQAMTEQVESLQALWSHKQKEIDQFEEKNRSLQKLNQQLSLTLNQQRKEIAQLQNDVEAERFSAQDKIKVLTTEIEMLRSNQQQD